MPRSSRHKSHKQKKDNSKGTRQHSDSEEDGKLKDRKSREEEAIVRVSRDLASSDKRKLASHSSDGNELLEEYSVSKRRKERATDDGRRGGSSLGDKETKKGESSRTDSEKRPRSKVSIDLKSKSSRRNESLSERKEENVGLAVEIDETKRSISSSSSKVESKRKPIKEDVKDKELGAERDRKGHDVGREIMIDVKPVMEVASGGKSRKQGSKLGSDVNDELPMKREVENTERKMQDELQNPELEKELEKRTRRRGDSSNNEDKHQDGVRDASDRILSTRDDLTKNGRYKDEKIKDDKYKGSYREDLDRDHRNGDDRRRDDRSSKYYIGDRSDTKRSRDESNNVENRHKKSKPRSSELDGSPHLENQDTSYKENRGKKRSSNNNEDHGDLKSQCTTEQSSKVEKKSSNSGKLESLSDRGRTQSRHADVDSIVSSTTQKSSPSPRSRFTKDQYRHNSKQAELKYKDCVSEERGRPTSSKELAGVPGIPERASEPQSMEVRLMTKPTRKDGNNLAELSAERPPISDAQASPMYLMERSHSSANIDHRHLNTTVRRSLDVEEMGRRSSGSKDAMDYSANEDRGSGEFPMEKRNVDELSQADGDTLSVSSSFNRPGQVPSSSTYLLRTPHPSRTGVDSPSILASSEEDSKGKSSDHYKRIGDSNGGRTHGTAWRGVPNWFSPITNGFIPFQHGPPPGGFHAMMQHFPASPLFGVRPSMELHPSGVPYHISDGDGYSGHGGPFGWRNPGDEICPPQLHGWDGSNGIFKDESHMHKRPDWDRNGHLGGQGWERGTEMSKGRNSGGNSEFPAPSHREDDQLAPADEVWPRQSSQHPRNERSRPVSRAESIEIKRSTIIPPAKDLSEAPVQIILEKTPGPSKTSNDSTAHFWHAYLSMLDISVDLTHPELYKQFLNLLDTEGNSTDGDNVNKLVYLEESKEAKKSISKTSLTAPLFPSIMDSALQRAMTLYKKQGEEMKAKHHAKSLPGSDHPVRVTTTDGEEPVPVITSEGEEKKLKAVPTTSVEGKPEEEPVPASCHEEVPTCDEEIGGSGVPIFCEEKVDEPVPTLGEVKPEELVSSSNHLDEVEAVTMTSNLGKLEEAVGDRSPLLLHASQSINNSPSNDDNINMASDSKDIYSASASSSEEQKGFSDETMCGPVLDVADGSSKAYEALMPESIDFSSVNLSRIHISPESTH